MMMSFHKSELTNSSTFELVTSNVVLGGRRINDSNFYDTFVGDVDEFHITQGYSRAHYLITRSTGQTNRILLKMTLDSPHN